MSKTDLCLACQKPFDEVHPYDWINDLNLCNCGCGSWRRHCEKSWGNRWWNPHIRITVKEKQDVLPVQEP